MPSGSLLSPIPPLLFHPRRTSQLRPFIQNTLCRLWQILSFPQAFFLASVTTKSKPTTYSKALSNPKWQAAMCQEIDALRKNGMWSFTSLPLGKCALGSK